MDELSASVSDGIPDYYSIINDDRISHAFGNLDEPEEFKQFGQRVRDPRCQNFVADFGDDHAWCAFDLDAHSVDQLLRNDRPSHLNTRWINIWLPYKQKDALKAIARYYDFSPRLLGLMCSDPVRPREKSEPDAPVTPPLFRRAQYTKPSTRRQNEDYEGMAGLSTANRSRGSDSLHAISHYRIADEVWHWSSVDWGRRFICLGYNSLYNVRAANSQDFAQDADLPHGKRVWSWLILTEDKTVISVNEDPFPFSTGASSAHERNTIASVRRHMVNVFQQLSKVNLSDDSVLSKLPIRHRLGDSEEETAHRSSDSPGLLFYYLFEDYYTTYSLVARQEHQYAAELDKLRQEMLQTAELSHIDRLHHIGRQLAVLKRIYQSYEVLIDRVLEKQEPTLASLNNSHIATGLASTAGSTYIHGQYRVQIPESESLLGVSLSSAARVRFERLKYRIRLYAISEIQECLDQKDSLVMMNFNLIAIKESYSVERLTRITLLLAKVTMIFMPVSLMTAYFSTQLESVVFTLRGYWISFGVILGVSIVLVLLFSYASGTMEGRIVYRPLSRMVLDMSKRFFVERRVSRKPGMREKDEGAVE